MIPDGERGSAPAEFVLASLLLVVLVLGVLQVGAVLLVRNTALDAAAEGARWAAVAGNSDGDGVARARDVLTASLGPAYASSIRAGRGTWHDEAVAVVSARVPLPVIGLVGPPGAIEVVGHAVLEPEP